MPAKSEEEEKAANMAHAIKNGYIKPKAGTASAEMARGMTDTQISHFRKEGVDEVGGNGAPVSYEDALTKVSQAIVSNGGDTSPFDVYTTLASLFGKRLKHVQQELDEKVDEDMGNKEAASMQQEQLKSEQGHIKLSEVLNKMIEGEEEELGGAAYDRENAIERGKKIKCQCGKQFVPSYGEYKRCPSCLSKQHSHGEKSTGVQEGEEEPSSQQQKDRFAWEETPYHSRRFEKSDVSWVEYDMEMNPQNYRVKENREEPSSQQQKSPLTQADKADIAKMSPEDQKKAVNCMMAFQTKSTPDRIMDSAMDLEALNKKYHTDVGNTTRK